MSPFLQKPGLSSLSISRVSEYLTPISKPRYCPRVELGNLKSTYLVVVRKGTRRKADDNGNDTMSA